MCQTLKTTEMGVDMFNKSVIWNDHMGFILCLSTFIIVLLCPHAHGISNTALVVDSEVSRTCCVQLFFVLGSFFSHFHIDRFLS